MGDELKLKAQCELYEIWRYILFDILILIDLEY